MNRKALLVLGALLLVAAGSTYWYLSRPEPDRELIRLAGNIEVDDVALSFKIPGEVVSRPVAEGESVQSGEVIARLDDVEWRQEAELRRAEIEMYQAELDELLSGARQEEIQRAEAALDQAVATARQKERDLERAETLYRNERISAHDYEMARTAHETAEQLVRERREMLRELLEGPREERIRKARAALEQAEKRLDIAETRLGYTVLRTPVEGVVLAEHVESGEYVVAGVPVVTVADLQDVWVRAYLEETDLGKVRLGTPVRVTTDSFPDKSYPGRVTFISDEAEFTPKNIETEQVRTRLVFRVEIQVENPQLELKPGMPATAVIRLESPNDADRRDQ